MNLFVYGTLAIGETLKNILDRDVPGTPATLDGYDGSKMVIIESESYPAAEKNIECSIQGLLIEITSEELQKLDWDSELQTNAIDFDDRATVATERVVHARQQLLQEVFSE